MVFKVKLLPFTQKDLEDALEYYNRITHNLAEKFYSEFVILNELLKSNPFLELKYKHVRTYKLKSFPYLVHFIVDERKGDVIIIAIAFGKKEKTSFEDRFINL